MLETMVYESPEKKFWERQYDWQYRQRPEIELPAKYPEAKHPELEIGFPDTSRRNWEITCSYYCSPANEFEKGKDGWVRIDYTPEEIEKGGHESIKINPDGSIGNGSHTGINLPKDGKVYNSWDRPDDPATGNWGNGKRINTNLPMPPGLPLWEPPFGFR